MSEQPETSGEDPPAEGDGRAVATRRGVLMLGAVSASAVVTIRPAFAGTVGSVLTCEIPVPDAARAGNWLNEDGELVPRDTPNAIAPPGRPLAGEDVRAAIYRGRNYPGADDRSSQAYTKYIRRLQSGTSGFTCFASLQMPRR